MATATVTESICHIITHVFAHPAREQRLNSVSLTGNLLAVLGSAPWTWVQAAGSALCYHKLAHTVSSGDSRTHSDE